MDSPRLEIKPQTPFYGAVNAFLQPLCSLLPPFTAFYRLLPPFTPFNTLQKAISCPISAAAGGGRAELRAAAGLHGAGAEGAVPRAARSSERMGQVWGVVDFMGPRGFPSLDWMFLVEWGSAFLHP